MAEGGDYGYDNPALDFNIDHDDDDKEQEVDRTGAFQPDAASTPAPKRRTGTDANHAKRAERAD